MGKYKIDVSKPAENDLRDIVHYISSQLEAQMTALNMMDTIEEAIMGLADMPHCPLVTNNHLATMGYRKLFIKNYIVFFSIDEKAKVVDVERILYARRDWLSIL